jgi:hypothetical protein
MWSSRIGVGDVVNRDESMNERMEYTLVPGIGGICDETP